jgi:hypothetical protein
MDGFLLWAPARELLKMLSSDKRGEISISASSSCSIIATQIWFLMAETVSVFVFVSAMI